MRSRAVRTIAVLSLLAVANCFRDSTGLGYRRASFGFRPLFSSAPSCGVDVSRVRIRLDRPETTQLALDTTVTFPATADSIRVALTVQLQSGATSEDFDLTLAMINAAGDTAYRGGPVQVTASMTPAGVRAPDIPMTYVGAAASAAGVRFVTAPATAFFGDTAVFQAVAFDSAGNPLGGAPLSYSVSPPDSALATVPNPCTGRVVARSRRGPAHIVAAVPAGPSATATLTVQPKPSAIAIVSGDGQDGSAGAVLPQPLVVRVTAADGLAVREVPVAFAATAGGGTLAPSTATTDSTGVAFAVWTLGATAGANTATASVAGLAPATFTAAAVTAGPAITLIFPGNLLAVEGTAPLGVLLGQPAPAGGVTVTVTSDSTQYVTVASPGTVAFAQGDTLKTIDITGVSLGVSLLHATAPGYTEGVIPIGVAPNVIVLTPTVSVIVGQTASIAIQLLPPAPAGGVTVTLASTDSTIVKATTPTVNFAAGQDTATITVQGIGTGIAAITATAPNYATGASVVTSGAAGQPAVLAVVAGDLQTAAAGTAVPVQPAVMVTDILGAPVVGATVTFAVVAGGGSITGASAVTDASGVARVGSWTLGTTPGTNLLIASLGSLTPVVFTATGQ
jgi:adhesin/invasin